MAASLARRAREGKKRSLLFQSRLAVKLECVRAYVQRSRIERSQSRLTTCFRGKRKKEKFGKIHTATKVVKKIYVLRCLTLEFIISARFIYQSVSGKVRDG